jgi:ABC-2 type transport system permease protein
MSNTLFKIFTYELQRAIRRGGYLFTTFGIPLLAVLAFIGWSVYTNLRGEDAAQQQELEALNPTSLRSAGWVDSTNALSLDLDRTVLTAYASVAEAQAALERGEIEVYYEVAADYAQTGNINMYLPRLRFDRIDNDWLENVIYMQLGQDTPQEIGRRLRNPTTNFREINVQNEGDRGSSTGFDSRFAIVYVFSLALMFSTFVTSSYLLQSVIEEKQTRLIEIFLASLKPLDLLGGKVLAFGVLGLLQLLVWVLTFWGLVTVSGNGVVDIFLSNINIPAQMLPLMLVYFLVTYFLFAVLFSAVGALSASLQEGPQYSAIFALPFALPFYFLALFATDPNGLLATGLSLFPFTAPISMIARAALVDVPLWQIALSIGGIILTSIGAVWITSRLFRMQTLLAGTVPNPQQLWRMIREG